ncbi:MAG: DUF2252 family protein [Polyangiaceae bacterium]|nr:DUF2252 family protein [Polyangiaceae bacterium]
MQTSRVPGRRPATALSRRDLLATGLLAALPACAAEVDDPRARWLHHTLVLDNQVFLERETDLTEGKFAVMSETLFALVRGTVPQFNADCMLPGGAARLRSDYLTSDTRTVAIIGDPHPENLSSYRTAAGVMTLDFGDFDGATYGPYLLDVRRFALSMWMAVEQARIDLSLTGSSAVPAEADREQVVDAGVRAYAEEVARIAGGEPGILVDHQSSWGAIADELLERAALRGQQKDRLRDYTVLADGVRSLAFKDIAPKRTVRVGGHEKVVFSDTVVPISKAEQELVRGLFEEYRTTLIEPSLIPAGVARLVGFGRRLGAGVSSHPNPRYYVLVYGVGPEPDEAVLLEFKEVSDAAQLPGLERFPDAPFASNAERVARQQRRLQGVVDADPWLGWATAGSQSFRVRERSGFQRNFAIVRMAEGLHDGELTATDVFEFSALAGRILARSHARAPTQSGSLAGPRIASALRGDVDGFAGETLSFVRRYTPVVLGDRERLRRLIDARGFRLGYRRA